MSQTKNHCEPLVAVWLRPSTTEPCICCKQVAEQPRGEAPENDVCMYVTRKRYFEYHQYDRVKLTRTKLTEGYHS